MILRGDPTTPKAGDLRIGFRAVPVQALSVIARQAGDGLAAYRAANGHVIDLVHTGAADADSMFRQARADEALLTWILRAVGRSDARRVGKEGVSTFRSRWWPSH